MAAESARSSAEPLRVARWLSQSRHVRLCDGLTVDAHDGPATDTGQLESLGP